MILELRPLVVVHGYGGCDVRCSLIQGFSVIQLRLVEEGLVVFDLLQAVLVVCGELGVNIFVPAFDFGVRIGVDEA